MKAITVASWLHSYYSRIGDVEKDNLSGYKMMAEAWEDTEDANLLVSIFVNTCPRNYDARLRFCSLNLMDIACECLNNSSDRSWSLALALKGHIGDWAYEGITDNALHRHMTIVYSDSSENPAFKSASGRAVRQLMSGLVYATNTERVLRETARLLYFLRGRELTPGVPSAASIIRQWLWNPFRATDEVQP